MAETLALPLSNRLIFSQVLQAILIAHREQLMDIAPVIAEQYRDAADQKLERSGLAALIQG